MFGNGTVRFAMVCFTLILMAIPTVPGPAGDGAGGRGTGDEGSGSTPAAGVGPGQAPDDGPGQDHGSGDALLELWEHEVSSRFGDRPVVEYVPSEDPARVDDRYIRGTALASEFNSYMGWGNAGPPSNGGEHPYLRSSTRWFGLVGPGTRWQDPWGTGVTGYADRYTHGTHDIVVILINYTDSDTESQQAHLPGTHDPQWFSENRIFNTSAGANTMNTYLMEASYGQFNLTGIIASNSSSSSGWYTADNQRSHYTNKAGVLFNEAMQKADADVDFSQFDSDGNGYIDHVMIVHAGKDAASGGDSTDIWSHRAWWWPPDTYDGVSVSSYAIQAEYSKLGVYCHEFGHDMGLPDLYDTDSAGGSEVVGDWDLMDSGLYNTVGTLNRPAHPNAWNKAKLGWTTPVVINMTNNNGGVYRVNETASATNDSVVYRVDINGTNQYFMVENRNATNGTYEEGLPQSGIIIWHVDEDMPDGGSSSDKDNDGPPGNTYYLVNLETPGNDLNQSNYVGDRSSAAFSESKGERDFNPLTSPGTRANDGTVTDVWIDRILDNAGWNRTLRLLVSSDTDPPGAPSNLMASDTPLDNGGSVNLTWDASADDGAGDDDVISYNIYVNQTGFGSGGPYVPVESVPAADLSSYSTSVSGLTDGVTYYFIVRSDDGPNENATPSNEDSAVPSDNVVAPVSGFSAADKVSDQGGKVVLGWTPSPDDGAGGNDVAGYDVYMNASGTGSAGPYVKIASLGPGSSGLTVRHLVNGTTYYFNVTAYDEVPNIATSALSPATPADDLARPPENLTVTVPVHNQGHHLDLDWDLSPDDGSGVDDVTGYEIYMNTTPGGGGSFGLVDTASPGDPDVEIGGLAESVTYYFKVASVDDDGNRGNTSTVSNTPEDNYVTAPNGTWALDVPGDQGEHLNVSWNLSTNDPLIVSWGDVTEYRLYMNDSGNPSGFSTELAVDVELNGTRMWTLVPGLVHNVTYFFRVEAVDDASNNMFTPVFNGTPIDDVAPPAPTLEGPGQSPFNTSLLAFSGLCEPHADVHIHVDGTDSGNATAGPLGAYGLNVTLPDGEHNISVRVFDRWGNGPSPPSPHFVAVVDTSPPTAANDAPPYQDIGVSLTLNGSASDDPGAHPAHDGIRAYRWRIIPMAGVPVHVTTVVLEGPVVGHTFLFFGNYTVELSVWDMANNTGVHCVNISIGDSLPPLAEAGPDIVADDSVLAELDGGDSTDNDPTFPSTAVFNWSYTDMHGERVYIDGAPPNIRPLELFDIPGNYTLTMNVTDRSGNFAVDSLLILVTDTTVPIADAGRDLTVYTGETFFLDASGSSDDDPLFWETGNFTWTTGEGNDTRTAYGVETRWSLDDTGEHVFTLTLSDRFGNNASDRVTITVIEGTPEPLKVVSTWPEEGAPGVSPSARISATFNKELRPDTVDGSSVFLEDEDGYSIAADVSLDDELFTIALDVTGGLDELTLYRVTLTTAIRDMAGNRMATAYAWGFTTGDVLEVESVVPPSGARDVLPDTALWIRFDAALESATLTASAFTMEGALTGAVPLSFKLLGDGRTVNLSAGAYLRYGERYTVFASDSIATPGGGPLEGGFNWSFRTLSFDPAATDPVLQQLDVDGDGIPDIYEADHGLDMYDPADAGLDADNDTYSNLQEYLEGTDPTDPEDVPGGDEPPEEEVPEGDEEREGTLDRLMAMAVEPLWCMLGIIIIVALIAGIAASAASGKKAERLRREEEERRRRERTEALERARRDAAGMGAGQGGAAAGGWGTGPAAGPDPYAGSGDLYGAGSGSYGKDADPDLKYGAPRGGRFPGRSGSGGRAKGLLAASADEEEPMEELDDGAVGEPDDGPMEEPDDEPVEEPDDGSPEEPDDGPSSKELEAEDELDDILAGDPLADLDGPDETGEGEGGAGEDGVAELPEDDDVAEDGPMEGEVVAECPSCGTTLYVPEDASSFICPGCETESSLE